MSQSNNVAVVCISQKRRLNVTKRPRNATPNRFWFPNQKKTYAKVAFDKYFHENSNHPPRLTETMMHTDLPAVLEKLRQSPKIKDAFLDNLLTREEWVSILGFHRTTLWRWEEDIINKIPPLKASYYETQRGIRSNYLDAYQRFLSAVIFLLKDESIKKGVRNNIQVIQFLKFNFMHLRRTNFEQWQENNNVYQSTVN
jgi:hypothetical protein